MIKLTSKEDQLLCIMVRDEYWSDEDLVDTQNILLEVKEMMDDLKHYFEDGYSLFNAYMDYVH